EEDAPPEAIEEGADREDAHQAGEPRRPHDEPDRPLRAAERANVERQEEKRREREEEEEVRHGHAHEPGGHPRDGSGPRLREGAGRHATRGLPAPGGALYRAPMAT